MTCEVVHTIGGGHARELTRDGTARGSMDAVFTLGGDGTAMEAVGALSGSDLPVGILPGGTGNQIARYLNTPLDIGRAVRALLAGRVTQMDLGRMEDGRRMALSAGFGMDVSMIEGASVRAKRIFGVGAYTWAGARALLANASIDVRATVDGRVFERTCAVAMIVNIGSFFAGRLKAGPGMTPDDGLLDLCVYSARSPLEGADVLRRCFAGDFRPHRNMLFVRGESVRLETLAPAIGEVDGELLAPGVLHAQVEPLAARLLRASARGD